MAEYVYALHDFLPEHEDEVSFRTGERIEVVEKDDLYGDGWWRGRNLAGKVGLFPQSYTTTAPPPADTAPPPADTAPTPAPTTSGETAAPLQALAEEPESTDETSPVSPVPHIYLNGDAEPVARSSGEVMQATMTDVQQAIEQLGSRNRGSSTNVDHDARSFSFASTNGMTTDDEEDETDFSEGEGWHKNARARLADKARQALAEAEKLEALSSGLGSTSRLPPIALELSDESEGEDDDHHPHHHNHHDLEEEDHYASSPLRDQYIPEEDEPSEPVDGLGRLRAQDENPATATAASFPINTAVHTEVPPTPVSPGTPPSPTVPLTAVPVAVPQERESSPSPLRDFAVASQSLPSPAPSAGAAAIASKHSSVASSTAGGLGAPSKPSSVHSAPLSVVSEGKRRDDSGHASNASANGTVKHPSEWTVDEVVDWLKSKGFDEDVCDKFTEQEITGDVLLDLDVNLLKTEIGVMAFGKRMRIANAIVDLRRPPSPSASFSLPQNSPQHQQYAVAYSNSQNSQPYPHSPHFNGHSRTQSQSHSQQSYTGHTSMQSSVGAPMNGYLAQTYGATTNGLISPQSAPATGDLMASPMDENAGLGIPMGDSNGARPKGRPAQLNLSPSDGALNVSATQTTETDAPEDERAVMSESELPHAKASLGRRIFGPRSPASTSSPHSSTADKDKDSAASTHSKEADASPVETKTEGKVSGKKKESNIASGPGRHARSKKSIDVTSPAKGNERLSIFGAAFGGTLGRKPAPRYSSEPPEMSFIQRLRRGRQDLFWLFRSRAQEERATVDARRAPDTSGDFGRGAGGTPVHTGKLFSVGGPNNPALLRKRTSSSHATDAAKASTAVSVATNGAVKLKAGMSVLEQIGETDHTGWMRKKGERYNSWKLRYFLLKGPDLYYLKTSSKSETKIKGHIKIDGYKVTVDENLNPGKYGFRIDHDHDKSHYFCSDDKTIVRDWMKAIMKATIGRDYSKPVVSSVNIPTIPLIVAQAMNPAPRPPSPTARAATQRAMRRENTDQPSTRDARVLMLTGFVTADTAPKEERTRLESFFTTDSANGSGGVPGSPQSSVAPARPARRMSSQQAPTPVDDGLIEWANSHLPSNLQITDSSGPLCDGLGLLRLAESIKGKPSSPPVPDSAFPKDPTDDNLDGLFRLFDFLLDNEVRMGSVSINDIRQGKRDKIIQMLRGLKGWEDKRRAIATSIGKGSAQAGGFIAPAWT
ncbi:hypothetical protein K438DRAFT_1914754 [Mycena galopus ATCC 62051]|nr:hypothetical protein K438DRAFT_1914754 [Mycena galopus ATCC 62051]